MCTNVYNLGFVIVANPRHDLPPTWRDDVEWMPGKVGQHLPIKFLVPLTKDSARHSAKRYLSNAGAAGADGGDVLRNQLLGSRFHKHLGANFLKL